MPIDANAVVADLAAADTRAVVPNFSPTVSAAVPDGNNSRTDRHKVSDKGAAGLVNAVVTVAAGLTSCLWPEFLKLNLNVSVFYQIQTG